jgi:arylsulfatase A-like enzyme
VLACESAPPPPPQPLVVDRSVMPARQKKMADIGLRDQCEVGTETRPAVGCPDSVLLMPIGAVATTPTVLTQRYRAPAHAFQGKVLFDRGWRKKGATEWKHLPPVVVDALAPEMEIEFPYDAAGDPGPFEVTAQGHHLSPADRTTTSPPIWVPQRATLVGGIGLDTLSREAGGVPIQFRLVAKMPRDERVLFDEVLDPKSEKTASWIDYRIDLASFAGRRVRFEMTTRPLIDATKGAAPSFTTPLWNAGQIVAEKPESKTPNVVLVSLDTLRADLVGVYGSRFPTTPNLDRFAEEAVLFEDVTAPYPSTTASHMSMLTGFYPGVHGVLAPGTQLSTQITLLSEIFAAHGYQTVGITEDAMVAAKSGFSRGFGYYREYKGFDPLANDGFVKEGVTSALEWLDAHRGERFFLFLHTYQVHDPYTPEKEFDLFSDASLVGEEHKQERNLRAYAGEVLYTDAQIGRLLDGLYERGLSGETVVLITADHGEAFGEHGAQGHTWSMIDEVLRIPLLLRAPGQVPEGVRIASPVSLVDVPPTLLALTKIPVPKGLQGTNLLDVIADADSYRDRAVFSEHGRGKDASVVVRKGPQKWMFRPRTKTKAFDLSADPDETEPEGTAEEMAQGEALRGEFLKQNEANRTRFAKPKSMFGPLEPEVTDKLRRLGYIE